MMDGWFEGSYIKFGETQLCAEIKDGKIFLEQGSLAVGPDFDTVINSLQNDISVWRDCADSILLCPEGFKRAEPK